MTPLERLFAVADCANGIGSKIDITKWTFLNNDLVVHVHRIPDGEWVGVRAETDYGPDGIGTTVGTLFDETGAVGSHPAVGLGAAQARGLVQQPQRRGRALNHGLLQTIWVRRNGPD